MFDICIKRIRRVSGEVEAYIELCCFTPMDGGSANHIEKCIKRVADYVDDGIALFHNQNGIVRAPFRRLAVTVGSYVTCERQLFQPAP
jgi:hypothetical protein